MTMPNWNPSHYLKYDDERTRAAVDLAIRVKLESPATIADLGCGPGNSTRVLRNRWPTSDVVGIDNSAEMIDAARQAWPDQSWQRADISEWSPKTQYDLIYSNAALQWLPNHAALIPAVFASVAPGGALAFQIPSSKYATVRTIIHEVSHHAKWTGRMEGPRNVLTMESPAFYYDALCGAARELDIWETEYAHVMESADAITDWIASTGLRPFLGALDTEDERGEFLRELNDRVRKSYEPRVDGHVLFPFRRTFVIAYR